MHFSTKFRSLVRLLALGALTLGQNHANGSPSASINPPARFGAQGSTLSQRPGWPDGSGGGMTLLADPVNQAKDAVILGSSTNAASDTEGPSKLFDGERTDTKWCIQGNEGWVVFKTSTAVTVEYFTAYHAGQSSNNWDKTSAGNTKAYALQRFNGEEPVEAYYADDSQWTTLGEETDNTDPSKQTMVNATEPAQFFRLKVTDSGDPNTSKAIRFYELEIYANMPAPTAINVQPVSVVMGHTVTPTITVEPEGASMSFTYGVDEGTVAEVSSDGAVTGLKVGQTTLTVTSTKNTEVKGTALITVLSDEPTSITVNDLEVREGHTATPTITVEPEGASMSFTYGVDDGTVAEVSPDGVVTGLKVGETTLTVTSTKNTEVKGTAQIKVVVDPEMPTAVTVLAITVAEGDYVPVRLAMEPATAKSDFDYSIVNGTATQPAAEMDDEHPMLVHALRAGQTDTLVVVSHKNEAVTDTTTVTVTANPLNAALNVTGGTLKFGTVFGQGVLTEPGIYPWTVVNQHGRTCAKSTNQHVGEESLSVLVVPAGFSHEMALSLDYMVESEEGFDGIGFLAEDGEGDIRPLTDELFFGEQMDGWHTVSVLVPAGTVRLLVIYVQDDDYGEGEDAAWLSNLRFVPPVPVQRVTVEPDTLTIPVMSSGYERDLLRATFTPSNATLTPEGMEWTSLNEEVVEVGTYNGRVKGVKEGTAQVVATLNGVHDTCVVQVVKPEEFTQASALTYTPLDPLPFADTAVVIGPRTGATPVMVPTEDDDLRYAYVQAWSGTAQAGDRIRFYSAPTTLDGYSDTYMHLLDADFHHIESDDDGGEHGCSEIVHQFDAAGTYHVLLRMVSNYRSGVVEMHAHVLKPRTVTFVPGEGATVHADSVTLTTDEDGLLDALPMCTHSQPAEYQFRGWYTAPDGGRLVTDATVFESDTSVYARWYGPHTLPGYHQVWEQRFEPPADSLDPDGNLKDPAWLPEGWTAHDRDGDTYNWYVRRNPWPHHGVFTATSLSYDEDKHKELRPDNWLSTPEIAVGAGYRLTFSMGGDDPESFAERMGVYVVEGTGEPVQLGADYRATPLWQEYTVDLSAYAGRTVRIAFVHHNCFDMWSLSLDCVHLWAPNPHTITFDANGGTVSMEPKTVGYGLEYVLPACGFGAPENMEFAQWNLGAVGDTIVVTQDTTVKAEWKPVQVTVTFDANGGTGEMPAVTVDKGSEYVLPECKFTAPAGKEFDKWDRGEVGKKITVTEDVTVKAEWKPVQVTITFDANGGTGEMPAVTVDKGTEYTLPACTFIAPENMEFAQWNLGAVGDTIVVTQDTTVRAEWKPVQVTITFDANGGTGEMPAVTVDKGTEYTLPACTFIAPENMEFAQWNLGAVGDTIVVTQDTTVKAEWKDKATGVDPNPATQLKVYPNPASNMLYINGVDLKNVSLYDMLGRLLTVRPADSATATVLNVNTYKPGVYLVRIELCNGQFITRKVLINN